MKAISISAMRYDRRVSIKFFKSSEHGANGDTHTATPLQFGQQYGITGYKYTMTVRRASNPGWWDNKGIAHHKVSENFNYRYPIVAEEGELHERPSEQATQQQV